MIKLTLTTLAEPAFPVHTLMFIVQLKMGGKGVEIGMRLLENWI